MHERFQNPLIIKQIHETLDYSAAKLVAEKHDTQEAPATPKSTYLNKT